MRNYVTLKKKLKCSVEHAVNIAVSGLPVHHLPFPLTCDHVQQGLSEVVSDAAIADHLISKDDKTQVVDILHVVLLDVDPVLRDRHTKKDGTG